MKNGFYLSPDGKNIVEVQLQRKVSSMFSSIFYEPDVYFKKYSVYDLFLNEYYKLGLTEIELKTILSSWEILN